MMHLNKYLTLILLYFVINLHSIPILQSSDTVQTTSVYNPEQNGWFKYYQYISFHNLFSLVEGLEGGDMVPQPFQKSLTDRGVAIKPASSNRWAGGVVPYEFASNISRC
ncbi:unnamed protein product [Adineta steineri]|uniref:Uncharacterized protein n=1 Tax=Adineta steineri TaxID=433720 RepID=A0A814TYM0_9BILA|nr:unnamed protein product [Adineta steineri]